MKKGLFGNGCMTIAAMLAFGTMVPAAASADTSPSCPTYDSSLFSQPFTAWGDTNEYTLVPGQSVDQFSGAGWQLSG